MVSVVDGQRPYSAAVKIWKTVAYVRKKHYYNLELEIFAVASLEWENVISFILFGYLTPWARVLNFCMVYYMSINA